MGVLSSCSVPTSTQSMATHGPMVTHIYYSYRQCMVVFLKHTTSYIQPCSQASSSSNMAWKLGQYDPAVRLVGSYWVSMGCIALQQLKYDYTGYQCQCQSLSCTSSLCTPKALFIATSLIHRVICQFCKARLAHTQTKRVSRLFAFDHRYYRLYVVYDLTFNPRTSAQITTILGFAE